ncbi:MAG: hypothetical protein QOF07_852 [Bradyrhizobium sp.]|jgi:hypothetical protein|nr:hypothetical protein [Bradyrhizobium sp.]
MSISVNPIVPAIAIQAAAPDLVLQPGSVIDAQVLKILSDELVRIAIAGVSIDVLSQVPLAAGQTLQLAVSQTQDGIRLAVVGPGAAAAVPADTVTLAPGAIADAAAASPAAVPAASLLTPREQVAVSAAVSSAAIQQDSLAPLFANLGVIAGSDSIPPKLQQAIVQVLAQQTSLDQNLTGSDVQNAFQKSGLFLEASLSSGPVLPAGGMPDLKAALIVLRQTLLSSLGTAGPAGPAEAAPAMPVPATPAPATATPVEVTPAMAALQAAAPGTPIIIAAGDAAAPQQAALAPALAPSLSPEPPVRDTLLAPALVPVAENSLQAADTPTIVITAPSPGAEPRRATIAAALSLLQETLQRAPDIIGNASLPPAMRQDARNNDVTFHTNTPPPPFRGALPSAQPVAAPSITPGAPLATTAHHLLGDTDAAIARQTLLQVASLPDRVESAGIRTDPAMPRWHFEIPFATPQGTAMAQFEISRDGGGNEVEAAKRVWRARFSLNVEPAGPVHALISLSGERTSVRMWAERPQTVAQLRAGAAQLSQALSKAELQPGDIVIRDGAPPPSAPAPAGHFLDRAL